MGYPARKGPGTSHWGSPQKGCRTSGSKYYGLEMGYSQKGHGTSGSIMGWRWGTPRKDMGPVKALGMEMGCPSGCGQTHTCENSAFCHTTYVISNY